MIVNENTFPYADERKSDAKFDLFLPDGSLIVSYPSERILSARLTQECLMKSTNTPRCQISVTVDNSDMFFNIMNQSNAYYQLNEYAACNFYLSSVAFGSKPEFVQKGRFFYSSLLQEANTVTLEYTDLISQPKFSHHYTTAYDILHDIEHSSPYTTSEILAGGISACGYSESVYVTDYINDVLKHGSGVFGGSGEDNWAIVKETYYIVLNRITKLNKYPDEYRLTTSLFVSDDGTLTLKEPSYDTFEVISNSQYVSLEVMPSDLCNYVKVRDRGNILRQLGDVVVIQHKGKEIKCVICKQSYNYERGILSAEWEGVIV